VHTLRELGGSAQIVAQSFGLSTRAANQLWRSYLGLEQMLHDEEYGEYAEPRMYSYFEEVFKRPVVRDWLQWNDTERGFQNQGLLHEFYGWIVGEPDEQGELSSPKLPQARSIRELGQIIDDESAMAVFRSPTGSLSRALARYEAEHPEDWKPTILQATSQLASLSPDALRVLTDEDIRSLQSLIDRVSQVLNDRNRLLRNDDVPTRT